MAKLLAVGAGGFVGAIARYYLSGLAHRLWSTSFAIGTLAMNVLGCLVIGVLTVVVEGEYLVAPNVRLLLLVGLLGSLTTFSTFGYETIKSLTAGQYRLAALNVTASVVLGLGAVVLGRAASARRSNRGRSAMKIEGEGKLLRIFIGEADRWQGMPLFEAIVRKAREEGLAGATVLRGLEGLGAHSRGHTARILRLSEDLPLVVEIVDKPERIEASFP